MNIGILKDTFSRPVNQFTILVHRGVDQKTKIIMDKSHYRMEQIALALRAAAKTIPAAMEEEAIRPDEVHALLTVIADQMEMAAIRKAREKAA